MKNYVIRLTPNRELSLSYGTGQVIKTYGTVEKIASKRSSAVRALSRVSSHSGPETDYLSDERDAGLKLVQLLQVENCTPMTHVQATLDRGEDVFLEVDIQHPSVASLSWEVIALPRDDDLGPMGARPDAVLARRAGEGEPYEENPPQFRHVLVHGSDPGPAQILGNETAALLRALQTANPCDMIFNHVALDGSDSWSHMIPTIHQFIGHGSRSKYKWPKPVDWIKAAPMVQRLESVAGDPASLLLLFCCTSGECFQRSKIPPYIEASKYALAPSIATPGSFDLDSAAALTLELYRSFILGINSETAAQSYRLRARRLECSQLDSNVKPCLTWFQPVSTSIHGRRWSGPLLQTPPKSVNEDGFELIEKVLASTYHDSLTLDFYPRLKELEPRIPTDGPWAMLRIPLRTIVTLEGVSTKQRWTAWISLQACCELTQELLLEIQ